MGRFSAFLLRLRGPRCLFVHSPGYARSLPGVPLDPLRGERILAALVEEGVVHRRNVRKPRPASLEQILRVHTPEYLATLQHDETLTRILGVEVAEGDTERALDLQRLMTGGSLLACRLALEKGVAANLGGGFHHAHADAGMGFCVFNDVAVALAHLRAGGFQGRVLVVDLDLHDGNGSRRIFAQDPTVHTFSIHAETWGDASATESTSLALGPGVDDGGYLRALEETLPQVADAFRPNLVVYLAGTDPAGDDRLGSWRVTAAGLLARDRFVVSLFRRRRRVVPLAMVLAGGYGSEAWRYSARFFSWLVSGRALEPPRTEALTLAGFRRIAASLEPGAFETEDNERSFTLSEEDLVGLDPGLPRPKRFLGQLSRHGVELLLERFGILRHLRGRGFDAPSIEISAGSSTGDTLRIRAEGPASATLVELRAHRSSRVIEGFELLVIEWLLLQNPREPFGPARPPLPGQEHPGLGLLKEFMGWLLVVCEHLGLDGVHFMASHYHVAVQSRRVACFLHPEDEGRMRAFEAALADLPLPEATRLAAESGVTTRDGQPVAWTPSPMVLPLSSRLRERVEGPAYESQAETTRENLRLRVA